MARKTAIFDTIASLIVAVVIIPACFAYSLDVGAGPRLIFVTLPTILQDIPMGLIFAIILYVAMIFEHNSRTKSEQASPTPKSVKLELRIFFL